MAEVAQRVDLPAVWMLDLDGHGTASEQTHSALRSILGRLPSSQLGFSISHTAGRALVAVTERGRIGVDIERSDRRVDGARLAGRFFHENERRRLAAVSEADRNASFLRLWTAKEAYLKALGTGLSRPLDSFEIAFDADGGPRLADRAGWTFHRLDLGEHWVATLATDGPPPPPQLLEYRP